MIRNAEHAFSKDGGLAVLYGNIALDGCIVKTAGVDESILKFTGSARVFESQDAAVEAILGNEIKAGDVVVIRYEGPRGGPGMQEMLYPTSYLKSKGLGKDCALVTDTVSLVVHQVFQLVTFRQKLLKAVRLVWLKMAIPSKLIFQTVPFT